MVLIRGIRNCLHKRCRIVLLLAGIIAIYLVYYSLTLRGNRQTHNRYVAKAWAERHHRIDENRGEFRFVPEMNQIVRTQKTTISIDDMTSNVNAKQHHKVSIMSEVLKKQHHKVSVMSEVPKKQQKTHQRDLYKSVSRAYSLNRFNAAAAEQFGNSLDVPHIEKEMEKITSFDLYKKADYNNGENLNYFIDYSKVEKSRFKRKEPLEVFFVKHSHIDPGWLLNVDEYFDTKVKNILDNMLKYLVMHKNMTFIWAETVYFSRWWDTLNSIEKTNVRTILNNGQLEMVTGGWVMPDEACTHYYAIIDQLIEGHQWLYKTLKIKPRHNWSVDPFGHSATATYLWKLAGFDMMVVQRIHQAVKNYLTLHQNLQFFWRQRWDRSGHTDILTYTDPWTYYTTGDSCGVTKEVCRNLDIFVNPLLASHLQNQTNVESFAHLLYEQLRQKSLFYKHNVILVMTGNDFEGDHPDFWENMYFSYSRLFDYLNKQTAYNIKVKFGTLNDYYMALQKHVKTIPNMGLRYFEGDFFPYSIEEREQWTGFFTTKPNSKRLARDLQENLRSASILYTLSGVLGMSANVFNSLLLQDARRQLGLFQHHDAITGTSKSAVTIDYDNRLTTALTKSKTVATASYYMLASGPGATSKDILFGTEQDADEGIKPRVLIDLTRNGTYLIVLFNPLGQARKDIVTLSTYHPNLSITENNRITKTQILPHVTARRATHVVFQVELPPLGIKSYTVEYSEVNRYAALSKHSSQTLLLNRHVRPIKISNQCYTLSFNSKNGLLHMITMRRYNLTIKIQLEFEMYESIYSGLYVLKMRPMEDSRHKKIVVAKVTGKIVSSVTVKDEGLYKHRVSIRNGDESWDCGGIHIDNVVTLVHAKNIEFVMRIRTELDSGNKFFVDSNGLQIVERRTVDQLPYAFYPMTSMMYIEDVNTRVTLHSRQSLAASSFTPGTMEILLDRNVDMDDHKGADEGVTDNLPAHSAFVLQVEKKITTNKRYGLHASLGSIRQNSLLQIPIMPLLYNNFDNSMALYSSLKKSLPCDMDVISMRELEPSDRDHRVALILHRWRYDATHFNIPRECITEWNISLCDLFPVCPTSVIEMSLSFIHTYSAIDPSQPLNIKPMEIKSYSISWH